jgi:hypothetical protein
MMTGYQTYARYTQPSQCASAVRFLTMGLRAWSGLWLDTLPYAAQLQEETPAAVRTEARRCAGRFHADAVSERELPSLLQVAVTAGDSGQVRATLDRQLALAPDEASRAALLLTAMQVYLSARPIQLGAAAAVLARFDTVAPTRRLEQTQGHEQVLHIATSVFDRTWMQQELATMRPLVQGLAEPERSQLEWFWYAQRRLWLLDYGVDSARKAEVSLFTELLGTTFGGPDGITQWVNGYYKPVGQQAPPIPAASWSPAPGPGGYPAPSTVTLLVRVSLFNNVQWTGTSGRAFRAMLTRFAQKYGAHGFQVVFLVPVAGFTPPTTDAERIAGTAKWFTEQFPFPVVVGEEAVPFTTRPLPDGRRKYRNDAISAHRLYRTLDEWPMVLVGKQGTFIWDYISNPFPAIEAELDTFIRQGVGLAAATTAGADLHHGK